ncbi:MAG: hypothetical protein WA988_09675 [Candidatus Nanopelagicales bacterium]
MRDKWPNHERAATTSTARDLRARVIAMIITLTTNVTERRHEHADRPSNRSDPPAYQGWMDVG